MIIRWWSDASLNICQLQSDICQTSTTFTPDIYHISDRYLWYMWNLSDRCLERVDRCVVGFGQMSGGSWQMSVGTSDRHLTIVWWSSDRENQTYNNRLAETVVYSMIPKGSSIFCIYTDCRCSYFVSGVGRWTVSKAGLFQLVRLTLQGCFSSPFTKSKVKTERLTYELVKGELKQPSNVKRTS